MTDPRIIAVPSSPEQVEPGPFSEHELREQWNAQADEFNQWESLDSSEQLAWAQTRAIAADRFLPPVAKPTPVDLAALHDPDFSGGLTPDQHLDVLWGGPDPRVATTPAPEGPDADQPVAAIPAADAATSDEALEAEFRAWWSAQGWPADLAALHVVLTHVAWGRHLLGWCEQHSDCDMPLYAQPQASTAQPTGPLLKEVGTLIAWLGEKATQAADTGASEDAGMLTWAAQVVCERVDEDAPDADRTEGPKPGDVAELCAEFEYHIDSDDDYSLGILRDMITAAITRWRAPVAEPVATPATQEPDGDRVQNLAAIIREADPARLPRAWSHQFAQALLAHPGFSGCHDGPAALPAPGFQIGPQEYIPHA